MGSLRLRLFGLLLVLGAVATAGLGLATYRSVRAEADELFDYHLRQMALSLRDQGRIADDERAALANPDFDYLVQIWSVDGVSLYSSQPRAPAHPLPPSTVLGFATVTVGGAPWRVFGAATPLRVVQVAQPLAVRQRLAAAAAGRSVWPIVAAVPLVGLAMWWLVGASLAPLQRVVRAAGTRDARSLEPLPAAGLPAELQPLVAAFNALLARLAAAFDTQRAFVADAAHELRTPLTALKLQLGLLQGATDEADRAAALLRLRSGVDRAARLVEQLLALARAEPGAAAQQQVLDLAAVLRQAVADAAPLAQAAGAQVQVQAPDALPWRGDEQALRGMVRNLVDNAVKYGGPSANVRVQLVEESGQARLWVDDSGPGIPAAERERVFDRFHRRDGAGADGSGLGLAIVRAVARQHGGDVTLLDAPGGGLRVQVLLAAP